MHRFYINPTNIRDDKAVLEGDEARHLGQVLRLQTGQIVSLFDGEGTSYTAEIEKISKSTVCTLILESKKETNPSPIIHIAQCIIKKKNMELIVQKCTELGAHSFSPLISQNCSLTYRPATQESRWQKIAFEACKQCGRAFVPTIQPSVNLSDFFTELPYEQKIILWENESENSLQPFNSRNLPASVLLLIGPEGGFVQDEVTLALKAGFTSASLGNLILRAETAAISALAITQYLLNQSRHEISKK